MDFGKIFKSIFWTIFPPESPIERLARTQFHHINSSKFFVNLNILNSKKTYKKWMKLQEKQCSSERQAFVYQPLISFLLNIENSSLDLITQTIDSIQGQISKNWEIIILGPNKSFFDTGFPQKIINTKIKLVISPKNDLSQFIKNTSGDYFVCTNPGDIFETYFINEFYKIVNFNPSLDIAYSDIDEICDSQQNRVPFFKPDIYSPELHLSVNFLSRSVIKINSAIQKVEFIEPEIDFLIQEWELTFLLNENKSIIVSHIPLILIHQYNSKNRNSHQVERIIGSHLRRTGINSSIIVDREQETLIRWEYKQPSISIIIPTRNNYQILKNFLNSLFRLTDYQNYEVILVDNNSEDSNVLAFYSTIINENRIRIVYYKDQFNYSKAINYGASFSKSEVLLFMNNDMEIIHSDWLTELCQWVMRPDIGIVGAKLLHANDSIQHAGVVLGLQGFVGHLYQNAPEHYYGLAGSVDWYRNFYAVTGACQIIRKEVFEELGGYDENFELVFSDIELCLNAISKGYRVLYTPNAILKHFEGKSRGYKTPRKDILRGYDLLEPWLQKEDPHLSPNLTYSKIPKCFTDEEGYLQRKNTIHKRMKSFSK